jgi:hypothetical protein
MLLTSFIIKHKLTVTFAQEFTICLAILIGLYQLHQM